MTCFDQIELSEKKPSVMDVYTFKGGTERTHTFLFRSDVERCAFMSNLRAVAPKIVIEIPAEIMRSDSG